MFYCKDQVRYFTNSYKSIFLSKKLTFRHLKMPHIVHYLIPNVRVSCLYLLFQQGHALPPVNTYHDNILTLYNNCPLKWFSQCSFLADHKPWWIIILQFPNIVAWCNDSDTCSLPEMITTYWINDFHLNIFEYSKKQNIQNKYSKHFRMSERP